MTATQVKKQLLEELDSLSQAQHLLLLQWIRTFRNTPPKGPSEHGPLVLHFAAGSPRGTWSREEIYGEDGR